MKTVLIAANPKSGALNRRTLVDELAQRLTAHGLQCEIVSQLDTLEVRAHELHSKGDLRTVVAGGGDGTVSAVAARIPKSIPVTILPLGSENLLAGYFGIPLSPEHTTNRILAMSTRTIDAMQLNSRIAILMATIGFDANVVRRVHLNRQSHITRWAYRSQILRAWMYYGWPTFEVICINDQGSELTANVSKIHRSQWCFVFNVPKYAAGLSLLQDAIPDDRLLDVGLFVRSGRIRSLFQYWDVLRGKHRKRDDWVELRATQISIRPSTDNQASDVQFDGDWACEIPVEIRVLPEQLVLVT